MGAFCLNQIGDRIGAFRLLKTGLDLLPNEIELWLYNLELMLLVGNVESAKMLWSGQCDWFARDYRTYLIGARIEYESANLESARDLLNASITHNKGEALPGHTEIQSKLDFVEIKNMMMRFESLGGRMEGCEFGLVQRAFGAEPIGLLRWADMEPEALISALEQRFQCVGEPDATILSYPHAEGADWTVRKTVYGMNMHTFQFDRPTEENFQRIFASTCRRLKYLKRKLLEDLCLGEKVFVYKVTYENL